MTSSVRSEPFRALAVSLRQSGFTAHAIRVEDVLDGTWTTSSELIGELGAATLAIRRECRPLQAEHKALVRQCLREVRKAWPGFGWFDWLPPRRWFV
jgi:hypothetical protein